MAVGTLERRLCGALVGAFALALSGQGFGAARLTLEVGVAGSLVPNACTSVEARISGVEFPFAGSLLLRQPMGNAWRGEATSTVRIPLTLLGTGLQEWAIPIYDATRPLEGVLLDASGGPLASATVNLDALRRDAPFPLQVGTFGQPVTGDPAFVDPEHLPLLWQSYEGISSVWLGRLSSGLNPERCAALARWILAGGTLVVFTGRDFYLLDSPLLRELLPIDLPTLTEDGRGSFYLSGQAKSGARVLLRQDAVPLLLEGDYGAGSVFLVTKGVFDVDEATWAAISSHITDAHLLSLASPTKTLLEGVRLRRPSYLVAAGLVAASVLALATIVLRVGRPRRRLLLLAITTGSLCLASGLYTIWAERVAALYQYITIVHVQDTVAITMFDMELFATDDRPVRVEVRDPLPWVEELPKSLQVARFDIDLDLRNGTASLVLAAGETRSLRAGDRGQALLRVDRFEESEVRIVNREAALGQAILFDGGRAYALGSIPTGESRFRLRDAIPAEDVTLEKDAATVFATIAGAFPFQEGTWLVASREGKREKRYSGLQTEVREVAVYVVKGGRNG